MLFQEEIWAGLDDDATQRCAPLLALLPGCARASSVPLAHNLAALLRRLLHKVHSFLKLKSMHYAYTCCVFRCVWCTLVDYIIIIAYSKTTLVPDRYSVICISMFW